MKNTRLWFGLLLIVGLAACSRSLVKSDYDREIDFASYRTFDWKAQSENAGSSDVQQNSLFEKRLRKAVDTGLAAKGLQKETEGSPDFLVTYSLQVEDQTDVSSSGYHYYSGFGYPYWRGYYGFGHRSRYYGFGYGPRYYGSAYYGGGGLNVYQYKEATLVLDFIDPETNSVIWRGLYKDEIDDSGLISKDKINEAITKILERFPPRDIRKSNVIASNGVPPLS